jgi:hypothetical protein
VSSGGRCLEGAAASILEGGLEGCLGGDKFGRSGGRAWNLVGTWIRKKVGIKDKDKENKWCNAVQKTRESIKTLTQIINKQEAWWGL